ncbi:MAG: hypothetical protein M3N48_01260 [Verrucomicrobiota bacterium]|nr:hypothetical protein [Verrucomicrobiota bacterium]
MLTTRSPAQMPQLSLGRAKGSQSTVCFARLLRLKVVPKHVQTEETSSPHLGAIARRVCWWEPVGATLENTPLFLCRTMALGTWEDICLSLDHYGRDAFREALLNAPPAFSIPIPGITGTIACSFCLFHPCHNASSRHETTAGCFAATAAPLLAGFFPITRAFRFYTEEQRLAGALAADNPSILIFSPTSPFRRTL